MKIQWDGKLPPTSPSTTSPAPSRGVNGPQFADTLKSALGAKKAAAAATAGISLSGLTGVRPPMEIISSGVGTVDTASLMAATESIINRLEQFSVQLGDPTAELKSLQPAVEKLSAHKEELSSFFGRLPEEHPLRGVVGDVLDTVLTIVGQFHRGDYGR